MKIFAVNGSEKGNRGVTYDLYRHFIKAMEEAGASINSIDLRRQNIESCRACMNCWNITPGKCVINDDMSSFIKEICQADLLVLESPVYLNSASSLLKRFIERCMPMNNRNFRVDDEGHFQHCTNFKIPPFIVISTCGLPGNNNFEAIDFFFEKLACGWDTKIVGKIYRSEAYLFEADIQELKVLKEDYFRRLTECAKEVVNTGYIKEATQKRINSLLLKANIYVETAKGMRFGTTE